MQFIRKLLQMASSGGKFEFSTESKFVIKFQKNYNEV